MSASMSLVILTYFYMDQAGLSGGKLSSRVQEHLGVLRRNLQGLAVVQRSPGPLCRAAGRGRYTDGDMDADRRKLW